MPLEAVVQPGEHRSEDEQPDQESFTAHRLSHDSRDSM